MRFRGISVQQLTTGRSAKTVVDQILVSGSNFLTGIILVRGLGLVSFGKFTVAYVILLLANSIQLSFISSPMITLGALCVTDDERRRSLGAGPCRGDLGRAGAQDGPDHAQRAA